MTKLDAEHRNAIDSRAVRLSRRSARSRSRTRPTSATRSPASTRSKASATTSATQAWKRIKAAAKKFGVEVSEKSWREIGKG